MASDFVYSWRRVMLPDSVADYAHFLPHQGCCENCSSGVPPSSRTSPSRWPAERHPALELARALWDRTLERLDASVAYAPDERTLVVELGPHPPVPYFLTSLLPHHVPRSTPS